jgi:tRNA(fMet)-specific endonuclease VapC
MIFLPDTNVWIKLLNPGETPVKKYFLKTDPNKIRLCSVVKAELYFGAYKSSRKMKNLNLLKRLFSQYESLAFDDAAAKIYGKIRLKLKTQGTPIGPNDLLIAAIALSNKAVVITHNTKEFKRVVGLKLRDWEILQPNNT